MDFHMNLATMETSLEILHFVHRVRVWVTCNCHNKKQILHQPHLLIGTHNGEFSERQELNF